MTRDTRKALEKALAVLFLPPWVILVVALLLPVEGPEPWAPRPEVFDPAAAWTEMDADILADVALGEDPDALAAVMWTVLNRARLSGRLLEEEIRDGRAYGSMVGDRWVPAWRRHPGRRWRGVPWEWERARSIALDVLSGRVQDPTGGATHFHRRQTWTPPWAPPRKQWEDVGSHHFYEEKKT